MRVNVPAWRVLERLVEDDQLNEEMADALAHDLRSLPDAAAAEAELGARLAAVLQEWLDQRGIGLPVVITQIKRHAADMEGGRGNAEG